MIQSFKNISPFIRVAMDNSIPAPWTLQERVIFDYELLLVKEGEILVTIEDTTYHGVAGDMFLFRPQLRHSITVLGEQTFRQPHLHFDFFEDELSPRIKISFKPMSQLTDCEKRLFRQDLLSELQCPFPHHFRPTHLAPIEKLLYEIIYIHALHLPHHQLMTKGLFIQLWALLLNELQLITHPAMIKNKSLISAIRDYIIDHAHTPTSLDELSDKFLMSKYHLSHSFKEAYGMSPIHYHQHLRIAKAKELIQYSQHSISEIAHQLGYTSLHSFSRAFKNLDGVSPSYYRQGDS